MGTASSDEHRESEWTLFVIVPHSNPMKFKRRDVLFDNCVRYMVGVRDSLIAARSKCRLEVVTSTLQYMRVPDEDNDEEEFESRMACSSVDAVRDPHTGVISFSRYTSSPPLWSKENLINIALDYFLQLSGEEESSSFYAWIDGDISFQHQQQWVQRSVAELVRLQHRGTMGFVQLFETAKLLGPDDTTVVCANKSFAAQHCKGLQYKPLPNDDPEYWHPGFAWASTRQTLLKLKNEFGCCLPERTLGSGDRHIALSLIGLSGQTVPSTMTDSFKTLMKRHGDALATMELRFAKGVVLEHHWHGALVNRQYVERWDILARHAFDPVAHMRRRSDGLVVWDLAAPQTLVESVGQFFQDRREDS